MLTIADYYRNEGEVRGKLEGKTQAKQYIANQLLNEGSPPDLISRVTGFTLKEIAALQVKATELA